MKEHLTLLLIWLSATGEGEIALFETVFALSNSPNAYLNMGKRL